MGILKIEIDLPDFESELVLDITIRKDGEVICTSPSTLKKIENNDIIEEGLGEEALPQAKKRKSVSKPDKVTSDTVKSGNFMNHSF